MLHIDTHTTKKESLIIFLSFYLGIMLFYFNVSLGPFLTQVGSDIGRKSVRQLESLCHASDYGQNFIPIPLFIIVSNHTQNINVMSCK